MAQTLIGVNAILYGGIVVKSQQTESKVKYGWCVQQKRSIGKTPTNMSDPSHARKSCLHASKTCRLSTVLLLTLAFCFVELISGYFLHSVAIIADAIHMLSDSGALIIAMVSVRISKRKSNRNTFGWIRAQELGAMVNCILLISLCFTILIQAVKRLITVESIEKKKLHIYIVVGIIGLCINVVALLVLGSDLSHGHSHGHNHHDHAAASTNGCEISNGHHLQEKNEKKQKQKKKKKHGLDGGQMNIRGAFLHVLNDAIGSVIVVIAGLAIRQWPDEKWVNYIDPVASLLMISLIITFTIPLLRESAFVLLQTAPMHIEVDDLEKRLVEQVPGVLAVHEFHVWQLSGSKIIASAHIRCHNLADYMRIAESVKDFFHHEGIHSTTIQAEFIDDDLLFHQEIGEKECILECWKHCSENTCCGQPSTYVKQPVPRAMKNPTGDFHLPKTIPLVSTVVTEQNEINP